LYTKAALLPYAFKQALRMFPRLPPTKESGTERARIDLMKELRIPGEEYLSTMYHPDREYVDGVLLERNVGERDHSRWQLMLGAYLSTREKLWGIYTFIEWRARVKPNRFRIPDLTVVKGSWPQGQGSRATGLPGDRNPVPR
jgi:hypothetical protein